MKSNNKTIQLTLLSIGLLLIVGTYFLYPIINKKTYENLIKNKGSIISKKEKIITQENLTKIEKELSDLKTIRRPRIQERIARAKTYENFEERLDYQAAKKDQLEIEKRIIELSDLVANAEKQIIAEKYLTKIEKELSDLKTIRRPRIQERIARAKTYENFEERLDYQAAKKDQLEIEKRIIELNDLVANAQDVKANVFENVEYKGFYNVDNLFTIQSSNARILNKEPNIVHMTKMQVTLYMKDGKIITISSDRGIYNKENYDNFFENNVKATDGETIILSENLELLSSKNYAAVYNNVTLTNNKSSVKADKIKYDFETEQYQISMFDKEKVKIKFVK